MATPTWIIALCVLLAFFSISIIAYVFYLKHQKRSSPPPSESEKDLEANHTSPSSTTTTTKVPSPSPCPPGKALQALIDYQAGYRHERNPPAFQPFVNHQSSETVINPIPTLLNGFPGARRDFTFAPRGRPRSGSSPPPVSPGGATAIDPATVECFAVRVDRSGTARVPQSRRVPYQAALRGDLEMEVLQKPERSLPRAPRRVEWGGEGMEMMSGGLKVKRREGVGDLRGKMMMEGV